MARLHLINWGFGILNSVVRFGNSTSHTHKITIIFKAAIKLSIQHVYKFSGYFWKENQQLRLPFCHTFHSGMHWPLQVSRPWQIVPWSLIDYDDYECPHSKQWMVPRENTWCRQTNYLVTKKPDKTFHIDFTYCEMWSQPPSPPHTHTCIYILQYLCTPQYQMWHFHTNKVSILQKTT